MSVSITIFDPVSSQCYGDRPLIEECLSFEKVWYLEGPFHKERQSKRFCIVTKKGFFLSGLVPRLEKYCKDRNVPVEILQEYESVQAERKPTLNGITFRDDQAKLIQAAIEKQRGVLHAPTGSGKTIIALGLMSCFPSKRILFLCHSISLVRQTFEETKKFGFDDVGVIGGGKKEIDSRITIATRQSFDKLDPFPEYDVLIVDECHHVTKLPLTEWEIRKGKKESSYGKILQNVFAPIRIGLTATPPTDEEAVLAMEGFLGPVIGSVSIEEGIEKGFLAKPKIKILKSPFSQAIKELRRYPDAYEKGIVQYRPRNRMIATFVKDVTERGETVLIIVNKIAHGELLKEMFSSLNVDSDFVQGVVDVETRERLRNDLNEKKIQCVIATTVWKEGINIPSLNTIVNAAGGKSEIATLQSIGRGLRTTAEKKEVLLVDIFDPSHYYLVNHFGERISLYCDMGWF